MSTSTLGRIAVRVTVWTGIGTYLNQPASGSWRPLVMTRLLDPSVFGTFSLATFWYTLLNLRSKAGINYSAIRQTESNGTLLGTFWGLDALLAIGSLDSEHCHRRESCCGLNTATASSVIYTPLMIGSIIVLMLVDGLSVIVSPLSLILEKELQLSRLMLVSLVAALIAYGRPSPGLEGAGVGSLLAVNVVAAVDFDWRHIYRVHGAGRSFQPRWHSIGISPAA